jgi:nicotinate-nucleotide--dimethylbenzimidazole phosphoribosyltransferase
MKKIQTLDEIIKARRDTRHFTDDQVPESVLSQALLAGHRAPSVGLTDATRYYLIKSAEVKKAIKELFLDFDKKAADATDNESQKEQYKALKLEAIEEAPIGLVIGYDRSVLDSFTIGTVGSSEAIKFSAVCAAQNIWLSLTEQGFSMGWVSILNYYDFKKIIGLPDHIEPLGYFCVGKPATDYDDQPMLQQLKWREKEELPMVSEITKVGVQEISTITKNKVVEYSFGLIEKLKDKIDQKTKPQGSLGVLEKMALQIGTVFQSLTPQIYTPTIVVFAADHGIANHGISAYPQDVTRQMVTNFLEGGAAINVFCNQNNISIAIVDAGVNYDFASNTKLISSKIDKGTQSFLVGPAMSKSQMELCLQKGGEVVANIARQGSNCIGFGEMGIGNTATAAILMSVITGFTLDDCIGNGTGVNEQQFTKKQTILKKALENYKGSQDLDSLITYFGGFEILQMAGGMLEGYQNNMIILVDGFISTVAYLIAFKKNPSIVRNAIFCHQSAEKGHQKLLQYLEVSPILQLDLRLGEGTGCAIVFPIIKSAVAFLNEMASFESAGVSNK